MNRNVLFVLFCLLMTTTVVAEDVKGNLTGEGGLGYNNASGNSNSSSLSTNLGLNYIFDAWENSINFTGVLAQNEGAATRERYLLDGQAARTFSQVYYGFGNFRYDRDLFSGYEYQSNITAGVGRRFWQQTTEVFNVELGGGYQVDRLQGELENTHPIVHSAVKVRYPVNKQVVLAQDFLIDAGDKNVHSESTTGLKVMMSESLALKLTYALKNNTEVLPVRDKLDVLTALNIVYGF
jgi:putative salt-induced outer membrane protein